MILIARVCLPIMAAVEAYLGAVAFLLLAVSAGSLSLHTGFHWCLLGAVLAAAAFGIYSCVYYFVGREPRRQVQVLLSAFVFFVLYFLFQSPAARGFI